ncbi:transcriptional regulator [Pseudomonas veronii]|uniref:transcriptional regulator n=1 Tax=Pseudomonas veronii TaxID=76761 RepID=UPI0006976F15|nr:transcriptional regulator [Pseudomonas veronii]
MAAEQAKASELELNSEQDRNTSDVRDSLPPPHGEKSSFESLCEKYISNDDRSPSLVNRIAYAMNQDERVRKICRVKARKYGCDLNDLDEILQRVMEVFVLSMLPKTFDTDAVYAVVYAVANNVTREVFRDRQKMVANHSSIEDMQERGEEIGQLTLVDPVEIDHDREIDTQTAKELMAEALQRVISGEQTVADSGVFQMEQDPLVRLVLKNIETTDDDDTPPSTQRTLQAPDGEKKQKSRTELSADQQELVDIGTKLGLRNQDYAFALGIGLPRLSSYIYGRTASVPDDVMKKARALFADEPLRVERLKRFNRPMSQILKDWEQRLNPKNDEDLATMLGVTKMTIYRWRNDETKPDPTALARYEQWIDEYEKRFSHMLEQRFADQK